MTVDIDLHRWRDLDQDARNRLLARPPRQRDEALEARVAEIIASVRAHGDRALVELTARFDHAALEDFRVGDAEFAAARAQIDNNALSALQLAIDNVRRFHEAQLPQALRVETSPGVVCERFSQPLEAVGLYVPAGTAPLPSAAVMLAVPAAIAGCERRILCTPPRPDGSADPAVLIAAKLAGVNDIYKLGGAQAIAAMAFGTETVPKVDKVFGPGNAWVTEAKLQVAATPGGAAYDLPAGPSELLVVADADANAEFVASDLLSQAEHGADSQVVLISLGEDLANDVIRNIELQIAKLSRRDIASASLAHARFIVASSPAEAVEISNAYAPEHLILQVGDPRSMLANVRNAGSVFLGPWSPEAAGDYCSGTNHVLPTYGYSRSFSGLGVEQFMRHTTVQELSEDGLRHIAAAVISLAGLEGLDAHSMAVQYRLQALEVPA